MNDVIRCLRTFIASALLATALYSSTTVQADYTSYRLLTVEWLIDSSDVIVVVRGESDSPNRQIVEVCKGDPASLHDKLETADFYALGLKGTIFAPSKSGNLQLLFVKDGNTVLQSVGLGRSFKMERDLHVQSIWYGVDQFGELLLEPSQLMDRVRSRAKADHTKNAGKREKPDSPLREFRHVVAGSNFPFESTDETFDLVVPATDEWRDHYIEVLAVGDALQRIEAIAKLQVVVDEKSIAAIRNAKKATNIKPGYRQVWSSSQDEALLTEKDVIASANHALAKLAE